MFHKKNLRSNSPINGVVIPFASRGNLQLWQKQPLYRHPTAVLFKPFQRTFERFRVTHTHAYGNPFVKTRLKVLLEVPLKLYKWRKIAHPTENLRENFAQKKLQKI